MVEHHFTTQITWIFQAYCQRSLTKVSAVHHVEDTAGGPYHYVISLRLEFLHLIAYICTTNAGMTGGPHVVTQSQNDFLDLKHTQK